MARQSASVLNFAVVASGSAGLLLAIVGFAVRWDHAGSAPFDAWVIPDLFALAVLFWLMRRMSAVQMTTRFLIAPLMANLISLALIRPHVEIQSWIGLALIAAGAGWIVLEPSSSDKRSDLTLRSG